LDHFTKWAEAVAVRHHTAEDVAQALTSRVFSRFGTPLRLLSDQGREFESTLFKDLCERLGIDKVRTSPYMPSTNGAIERFHRTLNSMIGKTVSYNQKDWDNRLDAVMTAYRAAKHESTGFTSNFLTFGRENRAPIDLVLGPIQDEDRTLEGRTYEVYVDRQASVYEEAYSLARQHLGEAAH